MLSDRALSDMIGLGPDAARRVRAALDLGETARARSRHAQELMTAKDVHAWAKRRIVTLSHEELWVLSLDGMCRLRSARCVTRGGVAAVHSSVRDVLRIAIVEAAYAFILVHNHPSGDPTPSEVDEAFTRQLFEASVTVGVPLVEHVVVATGGYRAIRLGGDLPSP